MFRTDQQILIVHALLHVVPLSNRLSEIQHAEEALATQNDAT